MPTIVGKFRNNSNKYLKLAKLYNAFRLDAIMSALCLYKAKQLAKFSQSGGVWRVFIRDG